MFCILLQTATRGILTSLITFLTTLIVHSIKRFYETYRCTSSMACQEKRTDWILRIFPFNDPQSPFAHYQRCLQVSQTGSLQKLRYFYSSNILQHWVGGKGLIYFCKVNHFRISRNFSLNWDGLNNYSEIMKVWLLVINMVQMSCFTSFATT